MLSFLRKIIGALLLTMVCAGAAQADSLVVATCGTLPLAYAAGAARLDTVDVNGNKCIAGTISATANTVVAAQSTLPTLGAGNQTPTASLAGAAYVQPVFGSAAGGGTQVDLTHGLPVNIIAGAGSGGTALGDEGAFTQGTTSFTPAGCFFNNTITSLLTGQGGAFQCTADRMLFTNLGKVGGSAFALGQAAMAGSLPVAIANNQSALPVGVIDGTSATGAFYTALAGRGSTGIQKIITCDNYAKYDASTTGDTQMIAASGSTKIYVCGYSIHVGGTATNVKLDYGTGTNCATGTTALTPAWQLLPNAGRVEDPPFWNGLATPASQALCLNASAANAVQAEVWYAQF